jgi:hypothetical protein
MTPPLKRSKIELNIRPLKLVLSIYVTLKRCKLWNRETNCASLLQQLVEAVSSHFTAHDSVCARARLNIDSFHTSFDSPGTGCISVLLQVSPQEKIQRYIRRQWGTRPLLQFPAYVTFSYCQMSSAASYWSHRIYLTTRGGSSGNPSRRTSRKLGYRWAVSLSGSRQVFRAMSLQFQPKIWWWNGLNTHVHG